MPTPSGVRDRSAVWPALGRISGIVAAVGDMLVPVFVALAQPGYDHAAQYMSELGAPGRPGASLLGAWWIVSGLALVVFALAVHVHTPRSSRAAVDLLGPAAIALYGLFTGVGSGVFPCDEGCVGLTRSGQLHDTVNAIGAMAQLVAPGLCWWRWRGSGRPTWWGLGWGTVVAQGVVAITFVGFMALGEGTHGQPGSLAGLTQRLYQGSFYAWIVLVALGPGAHEKAALPEQGG